MVRPRITHLSEYNLRNVLKVFAAFVVGVIAMFAGAVVYSRSHQSWASVRMASIAPAERATTRVTQAEPPAQEPTAASEQQTSTTAAAQSPPPSSARPEQTGGGVTEPEQKQASAEPVMPEPPTPVAQPHDLPLMQPQFTPLPAPAEAQPMLLTLQPGLNIPVRLEDTLSSNRNRVGDGFRAVLDAPLVAQGFVVAGSGATVFGRIASVRRARLLGGKAKLTLTLTELTIRDGHRVRIESNEVELEGSRGGIVGTAKMATGAAVGAVVGAVKGAAEGAGIGSSLRDNHSTNRFAKRTATLAAGTEVSFRLAAPVRVAGQANR
jgi:hypothetical protein